MMKNRQKYFWIVVLAALAAFFAACSFGNEIESAPNVPFGGYTRHYLALLKSQENHRLDLEQLHSLALSVLPTAMARSSVGAEITQTRRLQVNHYLRFNSAGTGRSAANEAQVDVYKLAVGGDGFVLASNDRRIGPILAIAEGSLDRALAEQGITCSVDARIIGGSLHGNNGWGLQSQSTDFRIQRAPLLRTNWGQGEVHPNWGYNRWAYNQYIKHRHNNRRFVAECGPVAIAKIVAHHNHIEISARYNVLGYHRPRPFNSPTLGFWSGTYDLSQIRTMEMITNTSPPAARGQVAALMFQIARIGRAQFGDRGTGMYTNDVKRTFRALGYSIMYYRRNATAVSGTPSSFTITYNTRLATIQNAINNGNPIFMRGATQSG